MTFELYYWITFTVSFICLMLMKTKLPPVENFGASLILSFFAFAGWPFYIAAYLKEKRGSDVRN